jgi:hypothetical protein
MYKLFWFVFLIGITINVYSQSSTADVRLTPVGMGDALIESFYDNQLCDIKRWEIKGKGLDLDKKDFRFRFIPTNAEGNPAISRVFSGDGVMLSGYNNMVLSLAIEKGTTVCLKGLTDVGEFYEKIKAVNSTQSQYVLPLKNAKYLRKVEFSFESNASKAISGTLGWFGLRDSIQLITEKRNWEILNNQPLDIYVRKDTESCDGRPVHYLLFGEKEYNQIVETLKARGLNKQMNARSELILKPYLGTRMYARDYLQEVSVMSVNSNPISLQKVLLNATFTQDKVSLREAAITAVKYALIPHWEVDFITKYPGGIWEQKAFDASRIAYELALACDLAGSFLTQAGEALILRRLAEDGIGSINYNVWKWQYIFKNNQLPVFSAGRIASYVLLEKYNDSNKKSLNNNINANWGHLKPYTDLAAAELNESLSQIFFSDGGFKEGPAYLSYTLDNVLPALVLYTRARPEKSIDSLLPNEIKKLDDYLEVLRSTAFIQKAPTDELIMTEDGQSGPVVTINSSILSVLARIRPNGAAAHLLAAQAAKNPSLENKIAPWALPMPDVKNIDPNNFQTLVTLPETGYVASARKQGNKWSKILVIGGNKDAVGHNHYDRGSFVLEYDGESFAVDPGGLVYADAESGNMKLAHNHNMLVPTGTQSENPTPNIGIANVLPKAEGDSVTFKATFSPGACWPEHYAYWDRTITSPNPRYFEISDKYSLKQGSGVNFIWHTPLPVSLAGNELKIEGKKSLAIIAVPTGCKVEIIPARKLGMRSLSTIVITSDKKSGELLTKVNFKDLK